MKVRAAIALAGLVFTSLFFIDLCNAVFACGCTSLWAGADAHCNVHHASEPHCPVCSHGTIAYGIIFGSIVASQMIAAFWLNLTSWPARLGIVLLLFPVTGAAVMSVYGWIDGYPINRVVFRSAL